VILIELLAQARKANTREAQQVAQVMQRATERPQESPTLSCSQDPILPPSASMAGPSAV
jgi:hypothetical protein